MSILHSSDRLTPRRAIAAVAGLVVAALIAALAACQPAESAEKIPLGRPAGEAAWAAPAAARTALDSGNAAFRARDYDAALAAYRRAAAGAPDEAAPWYGVYMVAEATKRSALADSALAEVKRRTSEPGLLSGGTLRAHADSASRTPHPTLGTKAPSSGR